MVIRVGISYRFSRKEILSFGSINRLFHYIRNSENSHRFLLLIINVYIREAGDNAHIREVDDNVYSG